MKGIPAPARFMIHCQGPCTTVIAFNTRFFVTFLFLNNLKNRTAIGFFI